MTARQTTVTIGLVGLLELPPIRSVLEIIEPEAEVVESICSDNVPTRTVNPPRPATLSSRDLHPERENQLDSAEAYR